MLSKVPQLEYVYIIGVSELIARAAKHLFTSYMQGVEMMNLSAAIAHFMNCFLGSNPSPLATLGADELQIKSSKRRNKRRGGKQSPLSNNTSENSDEWTHLTPKTLWSLLKAELKAYWDWELETDGIDTTVEKYQIHKVTVLRAFCQRTGIQVGVAIAL